MERIIDKFIKKYLEDLRFYALHKNNGILNNIYVFGKNGRNVAFINIREYSFAYDGIQLNVTTNEDLYNEISEVIGITNKNDVLSFLKNAEYFKTQFGEQILGEVMGYVIECFPNRSMMKSGMYLSSIDSKESDMVSRNDKFDDRFSYTVKRF